MECSYQEFSASKNRDAKYFGHGGEKTCETDNPAGVGRILALRKVSVGGWNEGLAW